jgi:hypothetical protein
MSGGEAMSPRALSAALALLAAAPIAAASAARADEPYDPFIGTYVGRAEAAAAEGGAPSIRDLDVVILRTEHGFGIESITVNHNGDRLDPAVSRRSSAMSFTESDIDGVYQRDFERDVFATRSELDVVNGDPLQWARISDGSLLVYSFVLNEEGTYELHTYRRTLDDSGVALEFTSELDGNAMRQVAGRLIRVEDVMDDLNP